MRPLEEVLADANQYSNLVGNPLSCKCDGCAMYRRELKEWEAKILQEIRSSRDIPPMNYGELSTNLAEIRRLLGRTEPEHSHMERFPGGAVSSWTGISNVVGPEDILLGRTEPEPSEKTAQVIRDARAGKDVVHCENADEMFSKLGLEPHQISQATARRLVEACEAYLKARETIDSQLRIDALMRLTETLAAARAELAGEKS